MLLGNVYLFNKLPLSQVGGIISNNQMIFRLGDGSFNSKASIPDGYAGKAYIMPYVAGSMSSRVDLKATIIGDIALGLDSSSDITSTVTVTGDGIIALSGSGSVNITSTINGDIVNIILGEGSAVSTASVYSTMVLIYGYASGSCASFTQSTGNPTLILHGSGTTVDVSGLTPASIWAYDNRTLTGAGGLSAEQQAQLDSIELNASNISLLL